MKRILAWLPAFCTICLCILLIASCNLPLSESTTGAAAAVTQTLSALATFVAAAQTAAPPTMTPVAATLQTPVTPPPNTPAPLGHAVIPGNMQAVESTIDDVLYNSDSYSIDLFERPYTEVQMVYRPDLDLQKINLSTDNTFFYFALNVKDIYPDTKTLVGNYGVELDTNRDGRGEYLVWVYQAPQTANWDTAGIAVFADLNHDVGGPHPLISDAPFKGDGYETELWPGKPITDADGAWVRLDPSSPIIVQIAVKRSLVDNPSTFLWSAWSDDQIKAPYLFDYNDSFTLAEAGSPVQGASNYPLAKLAQMDNTCRAAWGFIPVGNEPGLCKKTTVSPTAAATRKPSLKPTSTMAIITKTPGKATNTPVTITNTPTPPCSDVQVGAQVTDGSTWNPVWSSAVTLCLNGNCQNPDSNGYVFWYLPAGGYTINASSSFGISPSSASVKLGCGEKSLNQFIIGPG